MKIIYISAILLIFLVLFDIFLTFEGISEYGIEAEGNIIVKTLIENNNTSHWILYKIIGIGMLIIVLIIWDKSSRKIADKKYVVLFLDIYYIIIINFLNYIFLKVTLEWINILYNFITVFKILFHFSFW